MADEKFYEEVKFIFEQHLTPKKDFLNLRVRNIDKNHIFELSEMNYSKVFFDSDLNIYKMDKDGKVTRIENDDFEVVVMKAK